MASINVSSLSKPVLLVGTAVISLAIYLLATAIYNLFFHTLRNFPGPRLNAACPFIYHYWSCKGTSNQETLKLHNKYGEVVRISTNQLSFVGPSAWKAIYGFGHTQMDKHISQAAETPNFITAGNADHTRFRKALAPAFSEKGLREQEPVINAYVDVLISKLLTFAKSGEAIDMVKWYNLTTFDLIGDLSFGKPFGGLASDQMPEWVGFIFGVVKMIPFTAVMHEYPIVASIVASVVPRSLAEAPKKHAAMSKEAVLERVGDESKQGREDFMDAMLVSRGGKDRLTDDELASNAVVVILRGSETTATLLSGVTFWLLRTP
ncbi:hypothetical protein LTS18_000727 [Coniosporium uncinatum]|uniref:Uncharacterized protein n=1 Tax=Coniosporium uncinatum TaxID=93489 RepID=A0ACC3DUZ2_9PEZI|nr:hypothetical protein LTS18_000727 [Coniosporium uncinatum]